MPRSITRVKLIRSALPHSELNVRIARLAVLYEDLRIELYAAAEQDIPLLDSIGDGYRRLYFVRRAISTILEVASAIRRIDQYPEFREKIKSRFSKPELADWEAGVTFFTNHDAELRGIRDDVGGHFLERAADYALDHMGAATAGILTIQEGSKHNTASSMLKFVGEIVTVAIMRNRGGKEARQFYEETLQLLMEGLRHVTRMVHYLSYHYLWPRFGG
jgi:hypothetical protein